MATVNGVLRRSGKASLVGACRLVDLNGGNSPLRVWGVKVSFLMSDGDREELTFEVVRVSDEVRAASRAAVVAEGGASPVAAQGGVDDELVLLEVAWDVARVVAGEVGGRGTPGGRVGVAVGDVLRDLAAGEEPDHDALAVPFVRENASAVGVEGMTEAVTAVLGDRAAGVVAV